MPFKQHHQSGACHSKSLLFEIFTDLCASFFFLFFLYIHQTTRFRFENGRGDVTINSEATLDKSEDSRCRPLYIEEVILSKQEWACLGLSCRTAEVTERSLFWISQVIFMLSATAKATLKSHAQTYPLVFSFCFKQSAIFGEISENFQLARCFFEWSHPTDICNPWLSSTQPIKPSPWLNSLTENVSQVPVQVGKMHCFETHDRYICLSCPEFYMRNYSETRIGSLKER